MREAAGDAATGARKLSFACISSRMALANTRRTFGPENKWKIEEEEAREGEGRMLRSCTKVVQWYQPRT